LRDALSACEAQLSEARELYRVWRRDLEQVRKDLARLLTECGRAFADLPAAYHEYVLNGSFVVQASSLPLPGRLEACTTDKEQPDWTVTVYPTDVDLTTVRQELRGLESVRRQLREMEPLHGRRESLRAQREQTLQTLTTLEADLPADVGALRRKHHQ